MFWSTRFRQLVTYVTTSGFFYTCADVKELKETRLTANMVPDKTEYLEIN